MGWIIALFLYLLVAVSALCAQERALTLPNIAVIVFWPFVIIWDLAAQVISGWEK